MKTNTDRADEKIPNFQEPSTMERCKTMWWRKELLSSGSLQDMVKGSTEFKIVFLIKFTPHN